MHDIREEREMLGKNDIREERDLMKGSMLAPRLSHKSSTRTQTGSPAGRFKDTSEQAA